ncbi:MAG: hypothetical protein IJO20_04990 [Ruminococcus sp.]|nr:hypothetical protein [Ruminococcus sp.]
MRNSNLRVGVFSAFELKVLACVFMLIDHIGVILLPEITALRYIGRLAFPLFAYFIAEGCRYTKNKLRRFLSVFVLGVICELGFVIFLKAYYGNILLTFSASILLIYLMDEVKKAFIKSKVTGVLMTILLVLFVVAVYFYCEYVGLDYGFFGVLTPALALLFDNIDNFSIKLYNRVNRKSVSLFMFSLGLLFVSFFENVLSYQLLCLLSLPLLMLYNGERGKYKFKYGFYLFYPLHLVILERVALVLR